MTTTMTKAVDEAELATIIQTYNDVTEQLKRSHELLRKEVCRLRDLLDEKNKELQRRERLAALGEMAAGVAHEIRNPLGGIGLYASLLERDLVDRPPQLDIAKRINVGVRNMEGIVGDILTFAGGAEPNRQASGLADIIESALVQVEPRALALGVAVEVDPAIGDTELSCDAAQVERAMLNLLLNALDAVDNGGRVWVRLERCDRAGLVGVAVEDDGPGIDPAVAQKVFNPFFTTKDTGTGLGLAIVHSIAESHGGFVRVGQREGGGASLVMALPTTDEVVGVNEEVSALPEFEVAAEVIVGGL